MALRRTRSGWPHASSTFQSRERDERGRNGSLATVLGAIGGADGALGCMQSGIQTQQR